MEKLSNTDHTYITLVNAHNGKPVIVNLRTFNCNFCLFLVEYTCCSALILHICTYFRTLFFITFQLQGELNMSAFIAEVIKGIIRLATLVSWNCTTKLHFYNGLSSFFKQTFSIIVCLVLDEYVSFGDQFVNQLWHYECSRYHTIWI